MPHPAGTGAIVGPENIVYAASPASAKTTATAATLVLRLGPCSFGSAIGVGEAAVMAAAAEKYG